jgi:hypothetical protein
MARSKHLRCEQERSATGVAGTCIHTATGICRRPNASLACAESAHRGLALIGSEWAMSGHKGQTRVSP